MPDVEEILDQVNNDENLENVDGNTLVEIPSQDNNTQIFLVMPSENKEDVVEDPDQEQVLKSVEVQKISVTSSDATGLKSTVLSLIGDYETIVTDYTYQNGSYTSHTVDVQYDLPWIISAALFALCLYSCFKMWSLALRGNHRRRG